MSRLHQEKTFSNNNGKWCYKNSRNDLYLAFGMSLSHGLSVRLRLPGCCPQAHWLPSSLTAHRSRHTASVVGQGACPTRHACLPGKRIGGSSRQSSFAVPGVGRLGRHTLMGGWESVFPVTFVLWIEYLNSFPDLYKLCFSSYTYVVRKKGVLERNHSCCWVYT